MESHIFCVRILCDVVSLTTTGILWGISGTGGGVSPAGRFSKFGGDFRSPSHGRRAVARLFRATVRRPCQNAPQGRFFFDADVARQKRDFRKEVFISI